MRSRVAHFVADMLKPVGTAEGPVILLRRAFRREPVGAFPSELLSKDGAKILQPVIAGRCTKRTRCPTLLILDEERGAARPLRTSPCLSLIHISEPTRPY